MGSEKMTAQHSHPSFGNVRWIHVLAGVAVLLSLGTVYSWSVFRQDLQAELSLNATQSLLPYTLALVCYALCMPVAGVLIQRHSPQKIVLAGAVLVLAGYGAAAMAQSGLQLALGYGILAGSGVGLIYGVPLAVSARWIPEAKGLAIGLTVVGFGLSPLITAPLAHALVVALGVRQALAVLGVGIFLVLLLCCYWMRFPRSDFPLGSSGGVSDAALSPVHATPLLRQRSFYGLWLCYAMGTFIGLSAIGISVTVGIELFGLEASVAAAFLSLFAVCNGGSRPIFGWLTDHIPPWLAACGLYGIVLGACLLMIFFQGAGTLLYATAFGLLWFSLGGWLALAPTATMRLFPAKDYAKNYGLIFTAYGVGALGGTLSTGNLRDAFGSYAPVFPALAVVAVVGMMVAVWLLRARRMVNDKSRQSSTKHQH